MGSGASTAVVGDERSKSPTSKSFRSIRTEGSHSIDGGVKSSTLTLIHRILMGEQRDDVEEIPVIAEAEKRSDGPTETRASIVLMSKIIRDAVPKFKSYTIEDPTKSDLDTANDARQMLTKPEHYLQFYTILYKYLYDFGGTCMSFSKKTISFKNGFFLELIKLIVFEGSNKATFSERVRYFGHKHISSGVQLADYGVIGEAIVRAMYAVQNSYEEMLWAKVYSRFLRSLVPTMIMMGDFDSHQHQRHHQYHQHHLHHPYHSQFSFRNFVATTTTTGLSGSTGTGTASASAGTGVGAGQEDDSRLSMTDSANAAKQHNNSLSDNEMLSTNT